MSERRRVVELLLTENRGYLAATRRNGPSYLGKAGQQQHAQHEAKIVVLVELLEAELVRLGDAR